MFSRTLLLALMQDATREWAAQQRGQLDALLPLATDTHALLAAAADTEPNAAAKVRLV